MNQKAKPRSTNPKKPWPCATALVASLLMLAAPGVWSHPDANAAPKEEKRAQPAGNPIDGPTDTLEDQARHGYQSDIKTRLLQAAHAHIDLGHAAEIWFVATQKWANDQKTQVLYCVRPRIEVPGSRAWSSASSSVRGVPPLVQLVTKTAAANQVIGTAKLPDTLPAGASAELQVDAAWCAVLPRGRQPQWRVQTRHGSGPVEFGPPLN